MLHYTPVIQSLFADSDYQVDVLRLDLIDESISGNKWFKLKRNIESAQKQSQQQLLTFGGAYSNHIAATASACKRFGLKGIGVIRGERPQTLNATLFKAEEEGMRLHFVSRETYSQKESASFLQSLESEFGKFYLIPEGGNNDAGILGCTEILNKEWNYDYILCACGTGATYCGVLAKAKENQIVIGISVLKGENRMPAEVNRTFETIFSEQNKQVVGNEELEKEVILQNCITNLYAFKGYASYDEQLIAFKKEFEHTFKLNLDYIYTSKLTYALFDLMKHKKFRKDSKILFIHSGGLQGNKGFESRYQLNEIR